MGMKPSVSVKRGELLWYTRWILIKFLLFFLSSNIIADTMTDPSEMLRALILINLARHIVLSSPVASSSTFNPSLLFFTAAIFPLLLSTYLYPAWQIFLSLAIVSLPCFKYFSRLHFIYIPASSPRLLTHCSLHIALFLSPPVSPPWQPWPS